MSISSSGFTPDYSAIYSAPSAVTDQVARPTDEWIRRIAEALRSANRSFDITEVTIKQFLDRGGRIQLLEEGQQIPLKRGEQYIIAGGSGMCRCQAHAAYMESCGVPVKAILSGGVSAFNPMADYPILENHLYLDEVEESAFKAVFKTEKRPLLGSEFNYGSHVDLDTMTIVPGVKEYYQDWVNGLEPTHFITYTQGGPSVLMRLLGRSQESLEGFTLTFVGWGPHPIGHPVVGATSFSEDAYWQFAGKVAFHFPIVD